jgi:hypothetical protein
VYVNAEVERSACFLLWASAMAIGYIKSHSSIESVQLQLSVFSLFILFDFTGASLFSAGTLRGLPDSWFELRLQLSFLINYCIPNLYALAQDHHIYPKR